jgi:F0F1-type ATP synthase membrane subunit b/b'
MIQDRIDKIEATLREAQNLPAEMREELLQLLAELKAEVAPLTATHRQEAESIARFADASVHEVVRSERKPEEAANALEGLKASVEGFEASHPRLVEIVDRFAITLSNMGI